jgi:hypothetical protein
VFSPSYFLGSYIPHNATTSLSHYVNILQNLTKVKGVAINVSQILIDLLYSMLVKKNVAARNFTQVLSKFNDFLISRFDVSKATI